MHEFICLLKLLIISTFAIQNSLQSESEFKLHQYLFGDGKYNPELRPVTNASSVINVYLKIGIKKIFYMDEMNHKITFHAIMFKQWYDKILVWNPKDFDGIEYIYVPYSKIWTPQTQLVSKYSNEDNEASIIETVYDKYPVKLNFNGSVEFIPSIQLTSNCIFNYATFPLDVQMCNLLLQSPYKNDQVTLKLDAYLLSDVNSVKLWTIADLQSYDVLDSYGHSMNNLFFVLKRRAKSHLYILPSYIVYTMTLVMFLLPQSSAQRLLIGSTCLVMTTILTYMLSNSLPRSDIAAWPLLGKLHLFNAVMITFSLIFSAFIINISHTEHLKSVPDWLKKLTVNYLSKLFCIKSIVYAVFNSFDQRVYEDETMQIEHSSILNSTDDMPLTDQTSHSTDESSNDHKKIKKLLKNVYDHLLQIRYNYQKYSYKINLNNEWLLIASIIDRSLFLLYCAIVTFSTYSILKIK